MTGGKEKRGAKHRRIRFTKLSEYLSCQVMSKKECSGYEKGVAVGGTLEVDRHFQFVNGACW